MPLITHESLKRQLCLFDIELREISDKSYSELSTKNGQSSLHLPNQQRLLLSIERSMVINNYKDWFIDLYAPKENTTTQMMSVQKGQHTYVDSLTLLPDEKTVMAWDNTSVFSKFGYGAFGIDAYQVCLIDIRSFSAQTLTLPISIEGSIHAVNILENKEIELVIKHLRSDNYSSFSFKYQRRLSEEECLSPYLQDCIDDTKLEHVHEDIGKINEKKHSTQKHLFFSNNTNARKSEENIEADVIDDLLIPSFLFQNKI